MIYTINQSVSDEFKAKGMRVVGNVQYGVDQDGVRRCCFLGPGRLQDWNDHGRDLTDEEMGRLCEGWRDSGQLSKESSHTQPPTNQGLGNTGQDRPLS